jgi:hypothetical protein
LTVEHAIDFPSHIWASSRKHVTIAFYGIMNCIKR